jgi:hypothetical protein
MNRNPQKLQITVDLSDRSAILMAITQLYSVLPVDQEAERQFQADDLALMNLDYKSGDPYQPHWRTYA